MAAKSAHREGKPVRPAREAVRLALIYALLAAAWIVVTDLLTSELVPAPGGSGTVQLVKGLMFVAVTAGILMFIVRRQLQRAAALEEEARALSYFRESVIDNANIWINVLGPDGTVTVWNKAAETLSGYSRDEVIGDPQLWEKLYPDQAERERITEKVAEILRNETEVEGFETTIRRKDGDLRTIAWNSRAFFDDSGRLIGSIAIGRDMTERRRTERALGERERQLATLMSNLPGLAYRCRNDRRRSMLFVSDGCRSLTGYAPEQLVNDAEPAYGELINPEDDERSWLETQRAIAANAPFALEYRLRRADGTERWVWEQGRVVEGDAEDAVLEGIVIDIDDRKFMEGELAKLATHDPLTGVYNRRELEQQLGHELDRAERYDRPLSILWLDLDHFKNINDTLGHRAGDEVLRAICQMLEQNVRKADYVARYGGEEIIVVLPEMDPQGAAEMAERLRQVIAEREIPLNDGRQARITASIGVASHPLHGSNMDQLLASADAAMYQAKRNGRNRVCVGATAARA